MTGTRPLSLKWLKVLCKFHQALKATKQMKDIASNHLKKDVFLLCQEIYKVQLLTMSLRKKWRM